MRYAVYYTPPRDHDLTVAAAQWLGRDAFSGLALPATGIGALGAGAQAYYTAAPRRYGFHATLKAPFRLAEHATEGDLLAGLEGFCAGLRPVAVERLRIGLLGGFFALVTMQENGRLNDLANRVVANLDKFRAPLTDAELERRRPERMSRTELRNLYNWGYPYVFDAFHFHMTLTGHVEEHERDRVSTALRRHFGVLPDNGVMVDRLTLFVEREPGAPFEVHSVHRFEPAAQRALA
ncbi:MULTISPECIES: DUF1045 domain-containing protein [unclassified Roseitalea]|uniref:DUF1045 domain-containing protein n=1 Tax=unclassified Roseitalea TaxID=2639107 RepID=UPI00273DA35B|nr:MULTISPECIES: DUF1045 domain-containing protein [unclassified Roseitalea]